MQPTLQGVFEREEDLVRAAEAATGAGWRVVEIYSPYPMHTTARLLGLPRSRLPRAAFVFGMLGVGLAFWFQFWVSAFDWPLNVGGRPWNSLPAFVPVAFEMMVLFAGLGMVVTWLLVCRLYPGKKADQPSPKVTDDCFVLEIQGPGPQADLEVMRRLFRECQASGLKETECP
jgi:hypothetical protein